MVKLFIGVTIQNDMEPHKDEKQLRMKFNGKTFLVDETIYELVRLLNEYYKPTVASCSGHGYQTISIIFKDNTEMRIMTYDQARKVDKLFPDINGDEIDKDWEKEWKNLQVAIEMSTGDVS